MKQVCIGVLCFQGAFEEHKYSFGEAKKQINEEFDLKIKEVRKPMDLNNLDGLVIPGGESTTMSIFLKNEDFMESLKDWLAKKKAMWGTCAGLILLSNNVLDWKNNGQSLIGGLDVTTVRNSYGRQKDSFEAKLELSDEIGGEFRGIFIRAPAIKTIDSPDVRVLATQDRYPVSVRQNHLLATSFHPELTNDYRFHAYFIRMCLNTPSNG